NNATGVGHGYATANFHSPSSTLFIRGEYLPKDAGNAVLQGSYISFVLSGKSGYALTLTNFTVYLKINGTTADMAWVFLRSSLDNFASDLGSTSVSGTASAAPYDEWLLPLN